MNFDDNVGILRSNNRIFLATLHSAKYLDKIKVRNIFLIYCINFFFIIKKMYMV